MLIYEYVPNGSLLEHLVGKTMSFGGTCVNCEGFLGLWSS